MPNKMERFSRRARHVMVLAQEAAEQMRHGYIGTEHMLLGLMREEGGVAARVLRDLGLELPRVEKLVKEMTRAPERSQDVALDLSPATKRVLELAVDEARRMGHHYIGTEHLLLGLVRQSEGVAIEVLKRLGVNPVEVRRQTRRVLQEAPAQPSSPPDPEVAPKPRPSTPPHETVRSPSLPMTSQGKAYQVLAAVITRILDMVEAQKLTSAQAAEILAGLQPYLKPTTREVAKLIALSLSADVPEGRTLHMVVRDTASGAVKFELVLPLAETLDNVDVLVNAAASDYTGWLWLTDMDDHNRIEVRVEKEEAEAEPPPKEDDDANP